MVRIPLSCWLGLRLAGKQLFLCVVGSVAGILRHTHTQILKLKDE